MYLVIITWLYVTLMMAVAEATSSTGSLLGAFVTFGLYGLLPMGIVAYILGTPGRKRTIRAREQAQQAAHDAQQAAQNAPAAIPSEAEPSPNAAPAASGTPDAGGHATTATEGKMVAPVRKEP
jgi:predicted lipid-binding transport protein (Tim44 family)